MAEGKRGAMAPNKNEDVIKTNDKTLRFFESLTADMTPSFKWAHPGPSEEEGEAVMTSVVVRSDGTTTCCNAYTSIYQDSGEEYCKGCFRVVQVSIVKEGETLTMIAGAQPCVSFRFRPNKKKRPKKRPKPRNVRTTARRGRGKSSKR